LEKYAKEPIQNVSNWLTQHDFPQLKKTPTVLPSGYRPELDATGYCNAELHQFYQQQVGVLRWLVDLRRINICTEVSMMASFSAAPRMGHLKVVIHIFSVLSCHPRCHLVFDDSYVRLDDGPEKDWKDFYPNAI
jgi:hypothetical protein